MESSKEPQLGNSDSYGDLVVGVARAVGLGVWNFIPDSGRIYWSEIAREIVGMPFSETWVCSEFLRKVHPLDRQRLIDTVTACMDSEIRAPLNIEYRIIDSSGKPKWLFVKGQALFDSRHPQATEMFGIIMDVTLHKQAESRLEAIIMSAHDAVITVDVEGRVVDWNPAATKVYGYSSEEMLGQPAEELVPPERLEEQGDIYQRARKGETVASIQTERIRKDGKRIQILLTVSPVFDAGGGVLGISQIVKDITDQLASEEELLQVKRMESIGLLAGGIAHDFNNLLTVINGYTSRLLDQVPEHNPTHKQLLYIEEAGTRAQALTQQLLAFSRKQILQPRVVSLSRVIENLLPLLARLIREDVEVVTSFDPTTDRVEIDQTQLEQVVLNLVVNASDAMPNGGKLTIETSPLVVLEEDAQPELGLSEGAYIMLAVSDTGIGISPEILPQIFDPFFTTKPLGRGTGLGLASVHGIVKQSGGHVIAYSEMGFGTTIRAYLPASNLEIEEAKRDADQIEHPSGGGETILVVEDDTLLRRYAKEVLSDLGYNVIEAPNGIEALEISKNMPSIDLLITDVVMPAMSGRQLAEAMTERRPTIRVLYISGYTENTIAQNRILHPGVWYLPKPFTPSQLHRKVQEILRQTAEPRRILVVDDDRVVREAIASMLSSSGFEVLEAADGMNALDICRRDAVDLILLDLVMPEQEGMDTLRKLRKVNRTCPIVALSGFPTYLAPARALGASATLAKPVSTGTLIQCVRELVG